MASIVKRGKTYSVVYYEGKVQIDTKSGNLV